MKRLIDWIFEIEQGRAPKIPYNLHKLIRVLMHDFSAAELQRLQETLDSIKDENHSTANSSRT